MVRADGCCGDLRRLAVARHAAAPLGRRGACLCFSRLGCARCGFRGHRARRPAGFQCRRVARAAVLSRRDRSPPRARRAGWSETNGGAGQGAGCGQLRAVQPLRTMGGDCRPTRRAAASAGGARWRPVPPRGARSVAREGGAVRGAAAAPRSPASSAGSKHPPPFASALYIKYVDRCSLLLCHIKNPPAPCAPATCWPSQAITAASAACR